VENTRLFRASWFWYDWEVCHDYPDVTHSFFVVDDDQIIRERVSFSDRPGNGFDPSVFYPFDPDAELDPKVQSWTAAQQGWQDARLRFWYRKFYRETKTGQLMVLRSDEPDLYHYPAGRPQVGSNPSRRPENAADATVPLAPAMADVTRWLEKINFVLWVIVILIIVDLVARWR
jgi:hypothetical protein